MSKKKPTTKPVDVQASRIALENSMKTIYEASQGLRGISMLMLDVQEVDWSIGHAIKILADEIMESQFDVHGSLKAHDLIGEPKATKAA